MESSIHADAPLGYATIQIFPAHNRYEVFVCGDDEVEKLAAGLLEQLLPHLPGLNNLYSKGSNANIKLQVTELNDKTWFTKSTLNRFLQIVSSLDFMNSCKLIDGEMSQLEEARNFHISIHAKGRTEPSEIWKTDGGNSIETRSTLKHEIKVEQSDTSKDELLRAMDLRLTALKRELAAALNKGAGFNCSYQDIVNLISFCDHFGAVDMKNSLCKLLEPNHESASVVINDENYLLMNMSISDNANKTNGDTQVSRSKHLETPVKYGVSPALAAQVERQCPSESEESSNSSDENPMTAERSRNLTRSAQPRRSASPMRRVQIGRTGSRRAPALAIKSLGHYPVRERFPFNRDEAANSCEEEESEQISKKTEGSMRRMTVQDAINLFERRQKDESSEAQNRNSSSDQSICANISELRRWSSSTVECSVSCQTKDDCADPVQLSGNNVADQENSYDSLEQNLDRGSETRNIDVECKGIEKGAPEPVIMEIETNATQEHEINGISASSAEWSQQKEVELNQMLQKMMVSKPARVRRPPSSRYQNIPSKNRGGFYDHYKEKRDEKLRGENARKKAEKEAQFRAMQQTLDERKDEMVSRRVKDVNKKHTSPKPQKSVKNPPQAASLNKENPKASVMKKAPSKAPTLPATRKSWPSTPSSRVVGSSPSKISPAISSAGSTPTIRKPQSTLPVIKSRPKMERSQQRNNNIVGNKNDNDRSLKVTKENKQQTLTKNEKATKTKSVPPAGDQSSKVPSKPSLYNKVTRKGSVVPLESKPFLRKGSGVASGMGPIMIKKKCSPQSEETSINSGNKIEARDIVVATNADILIIQHEDDNIVSSEHVSTATEPEMQINCHQNFNEPVAINELTVNGNDCIKETAESSAKMQSEEDSAISPAVWEEIDECQNVHVSYNNETSQLTPSAYVAPVGLSSPRVRHSLSQMLQEECSEPDICEWGNAENPPAMAFQKDAPKGLKRLLKFARKSKGDANVTGWSSPSVFSEGEDDAEESKAICKRNTDNLLRKAALHSKNYGQQNTRVFAGYEKRIDAHEICSAESNLAKFGVHNAHKLQRSNESTAASTAKATRSFFSLSAFRGTKLNETKF